MDHTKDVSLLTRTRSHMTICMVAPLSAKIAVGACCVEVERAIPPRETRPRRMSSVTGSLYVHNPYTRTE